MKGTLLLLLILFGAFSLIESKLVVNDIDVNVSCTVGYLYWKNMKRNVPHPDVNVELVNYDVNPLNVSGRFALLKTPVKFGQFLSIESIVRSLRDKGATGIVLLSRDSQSQPLGYGIYYSDSSNMDDMNITSSEIDDACYSELIALFKNHTFLNVSIDYSDHNIVVEIYESIGFWVLQYILLVITGIALMANVFRFVQFMHAIGCTWNIAKLLLVFGMIGDTIRFISMVDYGLRRYFSVVLYNFLLSFNVLFNVVPSLLMALFWLDLVKNKDVNPVPFLSGKMRISFYIICAFIFLMEVVSSFGRVYYPNQFIDFTNIFYFLCNLSLLIFFLYCYVKVHRAMKLMKSMKNYKKLRTMNLRILIATMGMVIYLCGGILGLISANIGPAYYLRTIKVTIALYAIGMGMTSFFHALSCNPATVKKATASTFSRSEIKNKSHGPS